MDSEDFLAHYGVKGMKLGVRKSRTKPSRRTKQATRKDVLEAIRASRTPGARGDQRRAKIGARVKARTEADPTYGMAFEKELNIQSDPKKRAARAAKYVAAGLAANYVAGIAVDSLMNSTNGQHQRHAGSRLYGDVKTTPIRTVNQQIKNKENREPITIWLHNTGTRWE